MIGRKQSQHGFGIVAQQQKRGEANRRCRISSGRFGNDLPRETFGNCRRIAARKSSFVMTQRFFKGTSDDSRATVCWIIDCLPSSANNCLARRFRLRGQKRVPRPPARTTG